MSQTNDDPQTVTVRCSVIQYEETRDQLAQAGYSVVNCQTLPGRLEVTAVRQRCQCGLCVEREQEAQQ